MLQRFLQRKRLLIGGLGVVVLLGGYVLWSNYMWRQYEEHYKTAMTEAKGSIDAAIQLPQSTEDEKTKKITEVTAIGASYQSIDCEISAVVDWQSSLDNLQRIKADCEDQAMKLDALIAEMRRVAQYFKNDRELVTVMATKDGSTVVNEDTIEDQVKNWQQIKEKVQSLEVSEAFAPVKAKAQDAASKIFDVWQQLFDAHQAQDQPAYEEARANLAANYDTLAAIVAVSSQHLTELTKKLETAYNEAYL